jgi:uncharacterized protein (DUF1501 family)
MNRRDFLKQIGLVSLTLMLSPLENHLALAQSASRLLNSSVSQSSTASKRLIVIFLRGAVDGLSIVVPSSENYYYDARPSIAIPAPGDPEGALALNNRFSLHPALNSLMPFWQQKKLAFVHAAGSPDPSRSHFEAQDYMETGTPGSHQVHDGWMNRLLRVLPGAHSSTQAINFGPTIPRILSGSETVANISSRRNNARPMLVDRPAISSAFARLYNGDDELSHEYQEGREARQEISADLQAEMKMANNGAPLPNGFNATASQLAGLLQRDARIKTAFIGLGGWDTHINQGRSRGQLASRLKPLGEGLATLMNGLGPNLDRTTIVVLSEFGRTVQENGNGGTDHGHGNVMWLMGGGVHGGQVAGEWPGLADAKRYEGRDLAVTTDFRSVLASILQKQMGLNTNELSLIFPNFQAAKLHSLDLIR